MKKILLALFALTSVVSFSKVGDTNIYVKLGVDVSSRFKFSDEGENLPKKAKSGVGIFLEATNNIAENIELGAGIGYIGRNGKTANFTDEDGELLKIEMPAYNSIPLYLTAKYNFDTKTNFIPYIKADLGYSINSNLNYDYRMNGIKVGEIEIGVSNGVYAGVGVGVE